MDFKARHVFFFAPTGWCLEEGVERETTRTTYGNNFRRSAGELARTWKRGRVRPRKKKLFLQLFRLFLIEEEKMNRFFNHGIHRIRGMIVPLVVLLGFAVSAFAAEPGISVEARQRYPWNGLVDVKFTISGTSGIKYDTSFTAKDMVGGTNIAMKTIRKSDGK